VIISVQCEIANSPSRPTERTCAIQKTAKLKFFVNQSLPELHLDEAFAWYESSCIIRLQLIVHFQQVIKLLQNVYCTCLVCTVSFCCLSLIECMKKYFFSYSKKLFYNFKKWLFPGFLLFNF